MTPLVPEALDEVLGICRANAVDIADAFGRGWGGRCTLRIEAAAPESLAGIAGGGLAIVFHVGSSAAVLAAPASSGLLPSWYAAPDATGKSKLGALAQELSMLLWPDALAIDRFETAAIGDLSAGLAAAERASDGPLIRFEVRRDDGVVGEALLVWPLAAVDRLHAAATPPPAVQAAPSAPRPVRPAPSGLAALPGFSRSMLRVGVTVSVRLAHKRESIREIVELAPGALLKFDKSCEDLLHLCVGGCAIAEGEAVKVGEKFGFRVGAMLMPRERFVPVRGQRSLAS
jgi:flagellar motor switch protein FliN/FliY